MATGKSKAKRKAKKQAAAAYFKAFAELKPADADFKASATNTKQLTDGLGDNVSLNTKNDARKLDKLGRQINSDKDLREGLKQYNTRLTQLRKQQNGEQIERYYVDGAPTDAKRNFFGVQVGAKENQNGFLSSGSNVKKIADKYYETEAEALAAAESQKTKYNENLKNTPVKLSAFGVPLEQKQPVQNAGEFVKKDTLTPLFGYRQLGGIEEAYNELESISKKTQGSSVNKFAEQYSLLAKKLQGKLKREQGGVASQQTGLLNSDLASSLPQQDIIR
ncbi:MAG: hypothetical protein CTY37_06155 [Methylotenera sp.]|nr:MAG: hypothetical protein CTY37_06155 [Methylotenera sp.]